jgi:RNA polymerase sigma-70 factor (ECF subfamily)
VSTAYTLAMPITSEGVAALSDVELIERVRAGEHRAFDVLALRYQGRLAKLIGRYIHEPADVLDVVQEALTRAYRAIDRFRGDSAFYTWLYRIGVNAAKNHLDSRSRRPMGEQLVPIEICDSMAEMQDSATPEQWSRCEETLGVLDAAVTALPAELREALLLRELSGLSYEEIAETMACPIGTVRSRIFRARESVARELQRHND